MLSDFKARGAPFAGLLHTIIFNRALGPVRPREVDLQLFDLTYVRKPHI